MGVGGLHSYRTTWEGKKPLNFLLNHKNLKMCTKMASVAHKLQAGTGIRDLPGHLTLSSF